MLAGGAGSPAIYTSSVYHSIWAAMDPEGWAARSEAPA